MFDFPASPAIGTVSNGYTFDGMGWRGGPGIAGPVTEQHIALAGLTSIDIDVPTWAKQARIDGSVWSNSASAYAAMQFSVDGTTFYAGTSYQLLGGISHNVTGGYTTQAAGASPHIYLDYPKGNLAIPHIFSGTLNLECANTSQLFSCRSEMAFYDNTSAGGQYIWSGYLNVAVAGRLKKLRIFNSGGGVWPANSVITISWQGESASVPQTNAISDAPADSRLYRRRNNLWVPPQYGDVVGGGGGRHAAYASYSTSATLLVNASYTIRQTGGWLAVMGSVAGAVGSAGASAAAQIIVNGGGYAYAYAYGAAVNAYVCPTVICAMAHGFTAGTVVLIGLYSWVSAGTFYLNGYSGGAAGGMATGFTFQEIAV